MNTEENKRLRKRNNKFKGFKVFFLLLIILLITTFILSQNSVIIKKFETLKKLIINDKDNKNKGEGSASGDIKSTPFKWTQSLNGPSEEDEIDAVASDKDGNVFISGKFEETLSIGGQSEKIRSNGRADIMVVKYDREGNWLWTKHFGGLEEDNIFDADCDEDGNVILSGYFQDVVQFDEFTLTSKGGFDMVLVKLDPNGNVIWAYNYGGSDDDGGNEIVISDDDKILVGAGSKGTFEGIKNTGRQDAYLLSLDKDGKVEWIQAVKGRGDARAKAVAVDSVGNVYLGGDYRENNYVEGEGKKIKFDKYGGRDAYLVSYTSEGAFRWKKDWGNKGVDFCKGIACSSQDELYAVGQFQNKVSFNNDVLNSKNGTRDLFVWKLDNKGRTKWLRHIKSADKLSGAEVALNEEDDLVFGLGLTGNTDFQINRSDFNTISPCEGIRCPVLIKYKKNGQQVDYIVADKSHNGRFGEIAISGKRIYIDCEIIDGSYTFGNYVINSTIKNSKDAVITAVEFE